MNGKMIVNQNGEIRAYDTATGKKLWGIYNPHKVGGQFPWRPVPEATSPISAVLTVPGGEQMPVICDGYGLYRVEDGVKMKGLLTMSMSVTPVIIGDIYVWKRHWPPHSGARGAQRIKVVSRDEFTAESLWGVERGVSDCGNSDISYKGRVYSGNGIVDPVTGKQTFIDTKRWGEVWHGSPSPIIAGKYQYFLSYSSLWTFPVDGGPVCTSANGLRDDRIESDPEWRPLYAWIGKGESASPYAQANRIVRRSRGYLWCFGDPRETFPVPGVDDPATIQTITATADDKALLPLLSSARARYRAEAIRRLASLDAALPADAVPVLTRLVDTDPDAQVRAAAVEALDASDPAKAPGTAALRSAVERAFARQWNQPTISLTLQLLGEKRADAILLPLLAAGRPATNGLAAITAALASGQRSLALRDAILSCTSTSRPPALLTAAVEALPLWPGDPAVARNLTPLLAKHDDRPLQQAVLAYAQANLPNEERASMLMNLAKSTSRLRADAIEFASETPETVPGLVEWMSKRVEAADVDCIRNIGRAAGDAAVPPLMKALTAKGCAPHVMRSLIALKKNESEAVAVIAAEIKNPSTTPPSLASLVLGLEPVLRHEDASLRAAIVPILADVLGNKKADRPTTLQAIEWLGYLGEQAKPALPALRNAAVGAPGDLAKAIAVAIQTIEPAK
jgi:hypothetical protein